MTIDTCEICGHHGPTRHALVAWDSDVLPFGDIDRCEDEAECRARIIEAGGTWPLRENEKEPA